MRLVSNWRAVIRKAWSIKFIVLAGIFTGLEAIVSFLPTLFPWVQSGYMALATGLIVIAAFISRIVAQKGVTPDE